MIKLIAVKVDDDLNVVMTFDINSDPYVDPKLLEGGLKCKKGN